MTETEPLTADQQAALDKLHSKLDEENKAYELQRQTRTDIEEHIKQIDNLFLLDGIHDAWEDRMKELAAATLKPGSDAVLEEYDGALNALDYIWNLAGDRSWSSEQTEPFRPRALDYYVGRKFRHVWGTGTLVKIKDGDYGIRVRLVCGKCHKSTMTVYAKPGCHNGAFCYVYDRAGNYLADLRNQWLECDKCRRRGGV